LDLTRLLIHQVGYIAFEHRDHVPKTVLALVGDITVGRNIR
jgi:hypothetical protein